MRDGSQLCKNFVRQQSQEKKQTECLKRKLHHTDLQEGQGSDIYRAEEDSVKQGQRSEPRPARWREIAEQTTSTSISAMTNKIVMKVVVAFGTNQSACSCINSI